MPSRDYPAVHGSPPDNAEIAARLDQFASLLELAGASSYTSRAYRRAADLIRSTQAPVAELVRQGRARELRGIGPGIERRLVELVETGEIAELQELEREVSPELAGLGRFLGVSVKRMLEIGRVLGVRTLAELREAAEAGRLQEVPGIGPETERKLRAALAQEPQPAAPTPLLLHRSRPLVESIAEALGGIAAGDPRRWRDASERLAVVVAGDRSVLERFEALPQIVAVVERGDRRALGVTVEGVPVELVVAEPARLGTELVRATGSPEWVAAHEPLPDAADEEGVFAALGLPFVPPELREAGAPQVTELVEVAQIRGDLHCHSTWSDGRAIDPRDGRRRPRARLRVPGDLRPHGQRRRRPRARRRRRAPPGRGDRGRQRGARAVPPPARHRVRHPPRRNARSRPTTCWPSSTGCRRASTAASAARARS